MRRESRQIDMLQNTIIGTLEISRPGKVFFKIKQIRNDK